MLLFFYRISGAEAPEKRFRWQNLGVVVRPCRAGVGNAGRLVDLTSSSKGVDRSVLFLKGSRKLPNLIINIQYIFIQYTSIVRRFRIVAAACVHAKNGFVLVVPSTS